jgi:hypothetical protein
VDPNPPVTLRPQGFSPSRRFAPLAASWACSIPGALMGFALRGLCPPLTPYALSSAATLWAYPRSWPTAVLPTGSLASTEARTPGLGISQVTGPRASLSFSTPGLLAFGRRLAPLKSQPAPHTLLRPDRKLIKSLAPQGHTAEDAATLSRERRSLHAVLHLVDLLGSLGTAQGWATSYPWRPLASPRVGPTSTPCRPAPA